MAEIRYLSNGVNTVIFGEGKRPFVIIPGVSVTQVVGLADAVESTYNVQFKDGYKMYLIDRLADMPDGYSIEDMAKDCADAMKELGISHACVFGASQGAMITQVLMAEYPELVDRAVLGSSCCTQTDMSKEVFNRWIGLAESCEYRSANRAIIKAMYPQSILEEQEEAFRKIENIGTPNEFRHFVILVKAALNYDGTPYMQKLSEMKDRILVIGDKSDAVFSGDASVDLAKKIGCELYMYDGYGHVAYDLAPDYRDRMKAFFEK